MNMKINIKKIIIVACWLIIIACLYTSGLITADMTKIRSIVGNNQIGIMLFFVFISTFRVVFLIPSFAFIILGGMFFGASTGFMLSLISLIISETIIFIIAKYLGNKNLNDYLNKNHTKLMLLTKKYGCEFLALGIICPISPTDIVCFIASMMKFNYKNYIFTVIFANIPLMIMYSYLGENRCASPLNTFILITVISTISFYTISIWRKLKLSI